MCSWSLLASYVYNKSYLRCGEYIYKLNKRKQTGGKSSFYPISYAVTSLDKQNRSLATSHGFTRHNYVLDFAFYKLFSLIYLYIYISTRRLDLCQRLTRFLKNALMF